MLGVPLVELRESVQLKVLATAVDYTSRYRDCAFARMEGTPAMIVSGHQPELFHPGVWFKNFALSCLAERHHGVGIQLLVDNDLAQPWIEVPAPVGPAVRRVSVAMDTQQPLPLPYEDFRLQDPALLRSFGGRVEEAMRPIVEDPIITELWPIAISVARGEPNLGRMLAQSRHILEDRHGLQTLELPLSMLCATEPFHRFLLEILGDATHFASVYNAALRDYRTANRLRSRTHPVPELAATTGWQEVPFWIWSADRPIRMPLFVRRHEQHLLLRGGVNPEHDIHEIARGADGVEDVTQLADRGVKIRPRTLMTTMFLRLFLSDLFLHGIGGAKYDQLTDMIVERYWGIVPPMYLVLSATFRLPMDRAPVEHDDLRQIDGQLRELYFNPDRNLDPVGSNICQELAQLKRAKQELLQEIPERSQRKSWHKQLEHLNERLREHVRPGRNLLLSEKQRLSRQHKNDAVLCARDYSFCLHSSRTLFVSLLDLAQNPVNYSMRNWQFRRNRQFILEEVEACAPWVPRLARNARPGRPRSGLLHTSIRSCRRRPILTAR